MLFLCFILFFIAFSLSITCSTMNQLPLTQIQRPRQPYILFQSVLLLCKSWPKSMMDQEYSQCLAWWQDFGQSFGTGQGELPLCSLPFSSFIIFGQKNGGVRNLHFPSGFSQLRQVPFFLQLPTFYQAQRELIFRFLFFISLCFQEEIGSGWKFFSFLRKNLLQELGRGLSWMPFGNLIFTMPCMI